MAHIHRWLKTVGKIAEEGGWKVGEGVQAGEVDHYDDAEADKPLFVGFFSRWVGRCDKYDAEEDASEDYPEY